MSLTQLLKTFDDEKSIVEKDGRYIEKSDDGVSLKGVLQRGRLKLMREKKERVSPLTFRPSTLTYSYCRRMKVAQLAGLVDLHEDKIRPKLQLVFDIGHAIHDIHQRYFWELGILKGDFYCLKCDKTYTNIVSPKTCPSGIPSHGKRYLKFNEISYENSEYLIKARADGIVIINNEDHLLDIKSIANRVLTTPDQAFCFEDLVQPKQDHVIQLNLYMWLSGIHHGHLYYVAKNDQKTKSFYIPYDYETIRPYLQEIKTLIDMAQKIKIKTSKELPPPCVRESCDCQNVVVRLK